MFIETPNYSHCSYTLVRASSEPKTSSSKAADSCSGAKAIPSPKEPKAVAGMALTVIQAARRNAIQLIFLRVSCFIFLFSFRDFLFMIDPQEGRITAKKDAFFPCRIFYKLLRIFLCALPKRLSKRGEFRPI